MTVRPSKNPDLSAQNNSLFAYIFVLLLQNQFTFCLRQYSVLRLNLTLLNVLAACNNDVRAYSWKIFRSEIAFTAQPPFSKLCIFATFYCIYLLFNIMDNILSPMPLHKVGGNWDTPARAKVHGLYKAGHRPVDIFRITRIPEPTISRILKENTSRRLRKGRQYKPKKLSNKEVRWIIRYLLKSFTTQAQSIAQIKAICQVDTSESTIQWALKRAGYCWCVTCPRSFINLKQAKQQVAFAKRYWR